MNQKWTKRTVLITGGGSGIGRALAVRLKKAGHEVVVAGRRKEKLREAEALGLQCLSANIGNAQDREILIAEMVARFPSFDTLINNAGIQLQGKFHPKQRNWQEQQAEIETNFSAPVHLAQLALPHLCQRPEASIVNVTSGLAFVPLAFVPVYSATKAALHSFTLSLRHQLKDSRVTVVELAPPAVDTDLGGVGLHKFGVPVDEFADAVVPRLLQGEQSIAYGTAEYGRLAGRAELDAAFERMNSRSS
jgi:uncharacterized oxidoreductase